MSLPTDVRNTETYKFYYTNYSLKLELGQTREYIDRMFVLDCKFASKGNGFNENTRPVALAYCDAIHDFYAYNQLILLLITYFSFYPYNFILKGYLNHAL